VNTQATTTIGPAPSGNGRARPDRDREPVVGRPVLLRMADVQPEPIQWLWPGRVPLGKLTLLAGDPGLGKSLITLDWAARVSLGRLWPDGAESGGRGSVVILSAEDDPSDTIAPRLHAANADLSQIILLRAMEWFDNETKSRTTRPFSLERDLPALGEAAEKLPDCRLVIIDPIDAYTGRTDSHKNAEVRGLLAPLAELAARLRLAVVGIMHLTKRDAPALYRASGSLAFVAAARAVWAVARDKQDRNRRLFVPVKCNLAPDHSGLAFAVVESDGLPVVAWAPEAVEIDADEALAQADDESGEHGDAAQWLRETLADGPLAAEEMQRLAKQAGHAWRTVKRAKKLARVESYRDGFGRGATWLWRLREQPTTDPEEEGF